MRGALSGNYRRHQRRFPLPALLSCRKATGGADDRNMWPATKEVIRIVRPRYAFLENVPGLLGAANGDSGEWDLDNEPTDNLRYFGTILADLAEIGFDAVWTVLGADDVGAPHRRKRLWVLAYAKCGRRTEREAGTGRETGTLADGLRSKRTTDVAYATIRKFQEPRRKEDKRNGP